MARQIYIVVLSLHQRRKYLQNAISEICSATIRNLISTSLMNGGTHANINILIMQCY